MVKYLVVTAQELSSFCMYSLSPPVVGAVVSGCGAVVSGCGAVVSGCGAGWGVSIPVREAPVMISSSEFPSM